MSLPSNYTAEISPIVQTLKKCISNYHWMSLKIEEQYLHRTKILKAQKTSQWKTSPELQSAGIPAHTGLTNLSSSILLKIIYDYINTYVYLSFLKSQIHTALYFVFTLIKALWWPFHVYLELFWSSFEVFLKCICIKVHSPQMVSHLRCFHYFPIINSVVKNVLGHVSLSIHFFRMSSCTWTYWVNGPYILNFDTNCSNLHSQQYCMRVSIFSHLNQQHSLSNVLAFFSLIGRNGNLT